MPTKTRKPKAAGKTQNNGNIGVLVDHQIQEALKKKTLEIDPFNEDYLEPATYDLRVGKRSILSTASKVIEIEPGGLILVEPGAMVIVETFEILRLSRRMVGRVGPKSSLLRRGIFLSVGPQIDPGFHGRLFVNLINLSPRPFSLHSGDPFLTAEFQYLSAEPQKIYEGPYQHRLELSGEDIELLLAYQGPTLADLHRAFFEIRENIKDIAALRNDFPLYLERFESKLLGQKVLTATSFQAQITTLAPEPFGIKKPIPIVIRENIDGSFTASFFEANIEASGDNEEEAFNNVKSLTLDIFEQLSKEPDRRLGPRVIAQRAILESFIQVDD